MVETAAPAPPTPRRGADPAPPAATPDLARKAGLLFGAVALAVAAWRLGTGGDALAWGLAGGALVALALAAPALLVPPVRAWLVVAEALRVTVATVLLVASFVLLLVPARAVLVVLRRDPLRRRFPAGTESCWTPIDVRPEAPARAERPY